MVFVCFFVSHSTSLTLFVYVCVYICMSLSNDACSSTCVCVHLRVFCLLT